MKTVRRYLIVVFGVLGIGLISVTSAEEKLLMVGLRLGLGGFLDGQIKTIFNEALGYAKRKTGLPFQIKLYANEKDLRKDAANGLLVGGLVTSSTRISGFKPIAGFSLMGKTGYAHCLYIKKNSPITKVAQLKGKRLSIQHFVPTYYELRRFVGANPLEFFSKIRQNKPMGGFMALSLDQVDVAMEADLAYEFTKLTNPGSIKNVKPLHCSQFNISFPPLEARANLPPHIMNKFKEIILATHLAPPSEPFTRVVRTTRFQFVAPEKMNFQAINQIYKFGEKNGWNKDIDYWHRILKNKSMK